jgi:hypothetical protein
MATQSRVGGLTFGPAPVSTTPQELGPASGGIIVFPLLKRFASGAVSGSRQRVPFTAGFVYATVFSKIGTATTNQNLTTTTPSGNVAPEQAANDAASVACNSADDPVNPGPGSAFRGSAVVVQRKLQGSGASQNNVEGATPIREGANRFLSRGSTIFLSLSATDAAFTHCSHVLLVPWGHVYDQDNQAAGATQDYPYTAAND